MDKEKYGVHKSHCCVLHGCKYGDEDCPVVLKEIVQLYLCEECDYEGIESVEALKYSGFTVEEKKKVIELIKKTEDDTFVKRLSMELLGTINIE